MWARQGNNLFCFFFGRLWKRSTQEPVRDDEGNQAMPKIDGGERKSRQPTKGHCHHMSIPERFGTQLLESSYGLLES